MYSVYIHTNKSNNKCYIGITGKNPKERWRYNGNGYKKQKMFWSAICKYGWDNFEHIIFAENLTKEQACKMEMLLISLYETSNLMFGYNQSTGGESGAAGVAWSEERKKQQSEMRKGEKAEWYGRHHTDETKRKLSEIHKGMRHTQESREKMSKSRTGENNPLYGKHHSEETRRKISESRMGEKNPKYRTAKKVYCVELNIEFVNAKDAELKIGVCRGSINRAANGTRKTAGGYRWEYR